MDTVNATTFKDKLDSLAKSLTKGSSQMVVRKQIYHPESFASVYLSSPTLEEIGKGVYPDMPRQLGEENFAKIDVRHLRGGRLSVVQKYGFGRDSSSQGQRSYDQRAVIDSYFFAVEFRNVNWFDLHIQPSMGDYIGTIAWRSHISGIEELATEAARRVHSYNSLILRNK
jgi:hypothetical protein